VAEVREQDEVIVVEVRQLIAANAGEGQLLRLEQGIPGALVDEPRLHQRCFSQRLHGDIRGNIARVKAIGEAVHALDEAGKMQRDDAGAADLTHAVGLEAARTVISARCSRPRHPPFVDDRLAEQAHAQAARAG